MDIRSAGAVTWIVAMVFAGDCAATVIGYSPVDIRHQVQRADHVLYAKVLEHRRLGSADPHVPVDTCGVLYKIRVMEQFKGDLGPTVWFATHRLLFGDRPLSAGDHVLVMLRDLQKSGPAGDALRRDESRQAYARIRSCGDPQTTLYLAPYEENIFPVELEKNRGKGGELWMRYSSDTPVPVELAPRKPERCERWQEGACMAIVDARVAWESVRVGLKTWANKAQ